MSVSFDFSGKVVLITGSSSGIGASTAILLSKSGANVVVTGRNAQKVSEVAKECLKVSPNKSKALEVVADVSEESDCKRLIDSTIKAFGKLDILVNNAGMTLNGPITGTNFIDNYRKVLKTNLDSVVYLTHLSVEHLAKTKGNIINISTVGSHMVAPGLSPYCSVKSAVDMFTKCMAVELGPKRIRVNVINPGAIRTNFAMAMGVDQATSNAMFEKFGALYPVGRAGEGEDIASAIMFLASDQASFITGINLFVDGGHLAANVDLKGLN